MLLLLMISQCAIANGQSHFCVQMDDRLLGAVDAIHVATVLEDCVDQLAILGRIMPASFEFRPDAAEVGSFY